MILHQVNIKQCFITNKRSVLDLLSNVEEIIFFIPVFVEQTGVPVNMT